VPFVYCGGRKPAGLAEYRIGESPDDGCSARVHQRLALSNQHNAPGYLPADAWTASAFNDQTWPSGPGLWVRDIAGHSIVFAPIHTMIHATGGRRPDSRVFPDALRLAWSSGFLWCWILLAPWMTGDRYLNGRELLAFNMPPAPRPMVWDLAVLPGGPNPLGKVCCGHNIVPSNLREGDT